MHEPVFLRRTNVDPPSPHPEALDETDGYDASATYWSCAACANCGLRRSLAFRRGTPIVCHRCPFCRCTTLSRNEAEGVE